MISQHAPGAKTGKGGVLAGVQDQIRYARPRFTQRPGGQQEAVADATIIKHTDLQIALQAPMLQSIVADNKLGLRMALQQCPGRIDACRSDKDLGACAPLDQ